MRLQALHTSLLPWHCSHSGSLAFGAFMISLARVGQLLLWWAQKHDEPLNRNPVIRCVWRCVNCLADCFARFIEMVSEHAYVEVALQGHDFCTSAKKALAMVATKPHLFALVSRVAAAVRVMGVVFVVAGTLYISASGLIWFPPKGLTSATVPLVVQLWQPL